MKITSKSLAPVYAFSSTAESTPEVDLDSDPGTMSGDIIISRGLVAGGSGGDASTAVTRSSPDLMMDVSAGRLTMRVKPFAAVDTFSSTPEVDLDSDPGTMSGDIIISRGLTAGGAGGVAATATAQTSPELLSEVRARRVMARV